MLVNNNINQYDNEIKVNSQYQSNNQHLNKITDNYNQLNNKNLDIIDTTLRDNNRKILNKNITSYQLSQMEDKNQELVKEKTKQHIEKDSLDQLLNHQREEARIRNEQKAKVENKVNDQNKELIVNKHYTPVVTNPKLNKSEEFYSNLDTWVDKNYKKKLERDKNYELGVANNRKMQNENILSYNINQIHNKDKQIHEVKSEELNKESNMVKKNIDHQNKNYECKKMQAMNEQQGQNNFLKEQMKQQNEFIKNEDNIQHSLNTDAYKQQNKAMLRNRSMGDLRGHQNPYLSHHQSSIKF